MHVSIFECIVERYSIFVPLVRRLSPPGIRSNSVSPPPGPLRYHRIAHIYVYYSTRVLDLFVIKISKAIWEIKALWNMIEETPSLKIVHGY